MSITKQVSEQFRRFVRQYYNDDLATVAQMGEPTLAIAWADLYQFDTDLAADLREQPGDAYPALEAALAKIDGPAGVSINSPTPELVDLNESMVYDVGAYRSDDIGRLIGVSGQVSKRTDVRPKLVEGAFECQRCGTMNREPQIGPDESEPYECHGCERQGPFTLDRERSEWIDYQLLRVEEPPEQTAATETSHVDVRLEGPLTGRAETGDRVTVNGVMALEEPGQNDVAYRPYVDSKGVEVEETDFEDIAVDDHLDDIREIANEERGDPYDLIAASIAPKIRGMDQVKMAIGLQLFGGVRLTYPDGSFDRGDSHVLLLGDPGTAKSSLLQAVEQLAPRATFASGKGASAAGLTASAVKDEFGDGQWGLEAGALVLANGGIACVDEIDKVGEATTNALHEALEGQRVSINKAGINTHLPARTALLAAGNPSDGRFDPHESKAAQIDLDPALISRFDLMFMLDDEPNEQRDKAVVEGILDSKDAAARYSDESRTADAEDLASIEPAIDRETLRAYVAHAKQTVTPHLTPDVKADLAEWYVGVRMANGDAADAPIPVTHRKIEGAVRLAQASARVRLSETVETRDVELAKSLILRSMRDVGMDPERGQFDVDIVETGTSKTQRDRRRLVREVVEMLESETEHGAPKPDVVEQVVGEGIDEEKARYAIAKLKEKRALYEPDQGYLRVTRG